MKKTPKLSKDLQLLNKKRNLLKKIQDYNLLKEGNDKKDLLTFEELKKNAEISIKNSEGIEELKNSISIFDVDEQLNLYYLNKFEEIDERNTFNEFCKYMFTIPFKDRILYMKKYEKEIADIQKKYNADFIFVQDKELEKVFLDLLKFFVSNKNQGLSNVFYNFCTKYFIEAPDFNIPFIYGNDELIFSYLINSFYNFFCINKDFPELDIKENVNVYNIKIKKRKASMIKKVKDRGDEEEESEVENNMIENDDIINNNVFSDIDQQKFIIKYNLMEPFFIKYISEEFQENFKFFIDSISDIKLKKKFKYVFLSFFELYQNIILKTDKSISIDEAKNYAEFFYEDNNTKISCLKKINDFFHFKFYYLNNKAIDLNKFDIKNKDYYIEIKEKKYKINFYNYIIEKLFFDMTKIVNKKYETSLNNIKNYSLQGSIIANRCFNDTILFESFEKDFFDTLNGTTLEEAFNSIEPFERYNYPYKNNKFIEQLKEVLFYCPFPNERILGLSLRNLGIILINNNIFHSLESKNINTEFAISIIKAAFGKITCLHETNFHYLLKICSSQDRQLICKTPHKFFKNYQFKEKEKINSQYYDGGDFGETLIFGEKVYQLYLSGVEKIFNEKFWLKKKINFAKFGTEFILINKPSNPKRNLNSLSIFTQQLFEYLKSEIQNYNTNIDYSPVKNIGNISVRMRSTDLTLINNNFSLGQLSIRFERIGSDVVEHNFKILPTVMSFIKNN